MIPAEKIGRESALKMGDWRASMVLNVRLNFKYTRQHFSNAIGLLLLGGSPSQPEVFVHGVPSENLPLLCFR